MVQVLCQNVRRRGHTHGVSVIHRSAAAALGVVWKLYFSRNTSVPVGSTGTLAQ